MRMFLTAGARDLLDSAGCQNVKGGWPVQASGRIEAVLEAVGLRGLVAGGKAAAPLRAGMARRGVVFILLPVLSRGSRRSRNRP